MDVSRLKRTNQRRVESPCHITSECDGRWSQLPELAGLLGIKWHALLGRVSRLTTTAHWGVFCVIIKFGLPMIFFKIAIALTGGLIVATLLTTVLGPVIGLALGGGAFWFILNKML